MKAFEEKVVLALVLGLVSLLQDGVLQVEGGKLDRLLKKMNCFGSCLENWQKLDLDKCMAELGVDEKQLCEPKTGDMLLELWVKDPTKQPSIKRVALGHVEKCGPIYVGKLAELRSQPGALQGANEPVVAEITSNLVAAHAMYWTDVDNKQYEELGSGDITKEPLNALELIENKMTLFGLPIIFDDRIAQRLVNKYAEPKKRDLADILTGHKRNWDADEANKNFDTYWAKPCENFVRVYEPIFEPIRIELKSVNVKAKEWVLRSKIDKDFIVTWARYDLCDKLVTFGNKQILAVMQVERDYAAGRIL